MKEESFYSLSRDKSEKYYYERVEDYMIWDVYNELLGYLENLHRQRWAASGSSKKALL